MKKQFVTLATLLTLILFSVAPLIGQVKDPYQLSLKRELLYLGSGSATISLSLFLATKTPDINVSDLRLKRVNKFDRVATGFSSEKARKMSDLAMYSAVSAPLLLLTGIKTRNRFGNIALLWAETMLINQGLTGIIKSLTRRPRPYVYNQVSDPNNILSSNDRASFLSGHTSASAAATFLLARVYSDYNPERKFNPILWTLATTLPALTGYLRVKSGKHYPTDVIAGYLLGAGIGYFVPFFHRKPLKAKHVRLIPMGYGFLLKYKF